MLPLVDKLKNDNFITCADIKLVIENELEEDISTLGQLKSQLYNIWNEKL